MFTDLYQLLHCNKPMQRIATMCGQQINPLIILGFLFPFKTDLSYPNQRPESFLFSFVNVQVWQANLQALNLLVSLLGSSKKGNGLFQIDHFKYLLELLCVQLPLLKKLLLYLHGCCAPEKQRSLCILGNWKPIIKFVGSFSSAHILLLQRAINVCKRLSQGEQFITVEDLGLLRIECPSLLLVTQDFPGNVWPEDCRPFLQTIIDRAELPFKEEYESATVDHTITD